MLVLAWPRSPRNPLIFFLCFLSTFFFFFPSSFSLWLGNLGLDEVDGGLQVEAKVDEGPVNTLLLVLLLLQHEHAAVEELLQLLVGEVDQQLLKAVDLEDLKARNIQDADELLAAAALGAVQTKFMNYLLIK